jgi:hypothetical protein
MWILLFMYNLKRKTRVRTVPICLTTSHGCHYLLSDLQVQIFVIIKHFKGKVVQFMYEYFKVHQRTCVTSIRFDFYNIKCNYATFWHLVVMFHPKRNIKSIILLFLCVTIKVNFYHLRLFFLLGCLVKLNQLTM